MMPRLEELERWLSFLCLPLISGQCIDLSSTIFFKVKVPILVVYCFKLLCSPSKKTICTAPRSAVRRRASLEWAHVSVTAVIWTLNIW